jgi:Vault protein inter-alpha-trypsin domain
MDEQDYQPYEPDYEPPLSRISFSRIFTFSTGVILPAISITLEATTHICADSFFDPIPTAWHLALVIFVPLAHLHVWFAIRRGNAERLVVAGLLNGVAIGISIFYSLVYIPVMPLAALTLLFLVGLLPLAPLLSLVAGLTMRYQLKQVASKSPKKSFAVTKAGMFAGLGITVATIGFIELPVTLTRYGLQMASSQSPETKTKGIQFLRSFGSEEYLRRSCYYSTGWATDLIGYVFSLQNPVPVSEAQKIYYRVTGQTYDTAPPPLRNRGTMVRQNDFDFDSDQGGVKIGGKLKGLSLASSNLDASADPDGGAGYMQWTLVFSNDSPLQREARAEVQLPPGAVVSRLTLWVDGEEREAAFAGRSQVREAYEQVVRQRRDPVLVTTAGRDRILVQCFPVPSHGEMKIRIGVTVPLLLEDRDIALLLLPHFNNRNFRIPDEVKHSVWIESKHEMGTENTELFYEHPTASVYALRGQLQDEELAKPKTSIRLVRPYYVSEVWSRNPFESEGNFIRQSIEERAPAHLNRIVLVVDTSATTEAWARDIFAAIKSLPPEFDLKLVLTDADRLSEDSIASGVWDISAKLRDVKFAGGADNVPALLKAWELAAEKPGNNAIVWIHNPQPLLFASVEELRQRWERRPYGPQLYSVQIMAGPDEIEKKLDGIDEVKSVIQSGNLRSNLEALFARLTGRVKILEFVRTSKKLDHVPDPSEAIGTSGHLARLWANDEVSRILSARDESLNKAATTLAVRYQLVTPVSGAVVLETAEQYRAAGLKPVEPGTVPTIPEPEMIALLGIMAAIFVSWFLHLKLCRRRRYPL